MTGLIGFHGTIIGGSNSPVVQAISTDAAFTGTTRDITISSVDTTSTLILVTMSSQAGNMDDSKCRVTLTSSTNLRLTRQGSATNSSEYIITLVEFDPASIKSNQFIEGTFTSGQQYDDITISAVDTSKSIVVNHMYDVARTDSIATNNRTVWGAILTTSTNARLDTFDVGTTGTVNGQVIEFK